MSYKSINKWSKAFKNGQEQYRESNTPTTPWNIDNSGDGWQDQHICSKWSLNHSAGYYFYIKYQCWYCRELYHKWTSLSESMHPLDSANADRWTQANMCAGAAFTIDTILRKGGFLLSIVTTHETWVHPFIP